MVRLSKRVEYALIALRCFDTSGGETVTTRTISQRYKIPYDLLAKILQKLKKENILDSQHGINGGYKLIKDLSKISLLELIDIVDRKTLVADCIENNEKCYIIDYCTIKSPVNKMQSELQNFLNNKMVSELLK
ncbi:MAG: RrF2 family transcriptional regulator [Ignavibacteria bacterium]